MIMTEVGKVNEAKVKVPKTKDDVTMRAELLVSNQCKPVDLHHYYIDVEQGYCMRLHKTDQPTGFSFSPRTEDPIVVKESHMSITILKEDDDIYLGILVPDNYSISISEFKQI